MTTEAAQPRCTEPGCPWRWTTGTDRRCPDHDADERLLAEARSSLGLAAEELGISLRELAEQAPGTQDSAAEGEPQ